MQITKAIDRAQLEKRLSEYNVEREQAILQLGACNGAIQAIQRLIDESDKTALTDFVKSSVNKENNVTAAWGDTHGMLDGKC